jgi:hypothetical protein
MALDRVLAGGASVQDAQSSLAVARRLQRDGVSERECAIRCDSGSAAVGEGAVKRHVERSEGELW